MKKFIQTVILCLLCNSSLYSQHNYQAFNNIIPSSEASTIYCFSQDPQGLIWLGTNKGLFSYDGYSAMQHFEYGEKSNALIYTIFLYEDLLYMGTDNGILIYNYKTDCYEDPDVKFPSDVRAIARQDNRLWIGSLNGLFSYNIDTKVLVGEEVDSGLPHHTIYSIINTRENTLYIGTYNGFCRYIPESGKFEPIDLPCSTKKNNQFVNTLLEDTRSDAIWIGTEGALYKYLPRNGSREEISFFQDNSIKSLSIDGSGNLLLATDNGLYVYNEEENTINHVVHDSRNHRSLSNNIIWSVFADREDNIWLGTDYGISLSRFNRSLKIIPISQITGMGNGNRFHDIYRDSKGNFWLGGTNGLIFTPSLENCSDQAIWYKMGEKDYPISHNRIRHIYEDKENNLWVATDGSINRYDYDKRQFINYSIVDSTQKLNSNWAYHIFEDDKERLWIATCLGGIFVLDKKQLIESPEYYIADHNYSTENGLSGNFVNRILPDKEGNVWVLLYNNHINKINPETDSIQTIHFESVPEGNYPNYLISDKENFIWFGFRGGVAYRNITDGTSGFKKFDTFGNAEILSMNEINGNIWISTTEGVWVLNTKDHSIQRLDMTNKPFTCFYFDEHHNTVYLGGVDELVSVSAEVLNQQPVKSDVILTALYVNNELYSPSTANESSGIRYLDHIELNHDQNNLTFEFSDLVYSKDESKKFVYKLQDIDKDWNVLRQNMNRIVYTNLKYGNYKLLISNLDLEGNLSKDPYIFTFKIKAPWYYTIWAKGLYIVLILGFILWIINFLRVRNNLKIERIEKDKTVELTNFKIDFFTNIAHEFKTPLSLIIAPVSRLLLDIKDPMKRDQLELIHKNGLKLNALIHQVLDFNRIDNKMNSNLIFSRVEFVEFAKSIFSGYPEGYRDKPLHFFFHTNQEKIYMSIDVLKIESVLNNLISNACKYTKQGDISLILEYNDVEKNLKITLADTGIGIPAQELPYITERYYQSSKTVSSKEGTGIGLYLVKQYIEQHGGELNFSSEEDKGTSITIILPNRIEEENSETVEKSDGDQFDESRLNILVVEDNPEIALFIQQLLTPLYNCRIASNGKAGLEAIEHSRPDLILTDIMMPVMDGMEMSRRIKKDIETSTIPIIMLTAKDDKSTELESIHLSIEAFIPKPFDSEMLLSKIEQLLNSKQQIKDKFRRDSIITPKEILAVSPDEKFLSGIIEIIENKISDPDLNVNALSSLSGIGSKQIYRKLKQLTGKSPVEFIRSIRIKKAAMLLSQKKFTVAEVMYMVGFSNHSYFAKCFYSELGKTPKEFIS